MSEKGKHYITASHEVKPEDLEFEKGNIVEFSEKKDAYKLSLTHLLYGKFKYDRDDIKINRW